MADQGSSWFPSPHPGPLQVQGWAGTSTALGPRSAQHLRFLHGSQQAAASAGGGWGRPGEAARGSGGRGCARACQRVPGIIYDVRPMSLSAGPLRLLRAGGGWRLDGQASLPPGPPGPLPIHPAVVPPRRVTSDCEPPFISLSLTLFPCVCLSAFFWFLRPYVPSVSVPSCSGSLSISPPSAPPWPSPWLSLSLYLSLLASSSQCLPCALQLSHQRLSLPSPAPCSVAAYPLALAPLLPTPPLSLTPGSGRENLGCLEMRRRNPFLPLPPSPRGRSWAAVLGRAVGRTGSP